MLSLGLRRIKLDHIVCACAPRNHQAGLNAVWITGINDSSSFYPGSFACENNKVFVKLGRSPCHEMVYILPVDFGYFDGMLCELALAGISSGTIAAMVMMNCSALMR
jgi:hypothetical protein